MNGTNGDATEFDFVLVLCLQFNAPKRTLLAPVEAALPFESERWTVAGVGSETDEQSALPEPGKCNQQPPLPAACWGTPRGSSQLLLGHFCKTVRSSLSGSVF